ncbi:MAG: LCP family protein [Blautia faecis]
MIKTKKQDRVPGIIISAVLFCAEMAFIVLLLYTKLISVKYIGVISAVLLVFLLLVYLLVRKARKKIRFIIGVVLSVLILAVLGTGSLYIYKTVSALDTITGVNKDVTKINVYVKEDDPAQKLADASGYTFGILSELDRDNTDQALQQMYYELGSDVQTNEYSGLSELADSLNNGTTGAIILNQAYLDVLDEMDNYSSFSSQLREIASLQVETVVQRKTPQVTEATGSTTETSDNSSADAAVTDEVYTIYVSGIDTRGEMTASSRSDVNIILTVNTRTKQILMISTPRDYFVPLSISNGVPDKLTHAGIYGVNVSMDTLNMLYDININYYFRLNFAGFEKIIDALGGITVNSDYEFDSQNTKGYHFNKGENHLNGEQALVFTRERYAFEEGDRQRGRDQMAVIQGVVDKATQPAFLKNYLSVMDSLDGCFETNVPYDIIASLVRRQLDEGGSWQVLSYSADGTGDTQKPYSMSQKAYVMIPDQTTVDKAKTLMKKVREGFMLSEADVAR